MEEIHICSHIEIYKFTTTLNLLNHKTLQFPTIRIWLINFGLTILQFGAIVLEVHHSIKILIFH